jgi:hypothetical protein
MNSSISHLVIELSRMNGTISHSIISYLLASYFVILDGVADTAHQFRDLPASYVCEILLCPLSCMQFYTLIGTAYTGLWLWMDNVESIYLNVIAFLLLLFSRSLFGFLSSQ